jgi:transcriptional pleiotropic regulator of transition state genes
VEIEPKNPKRDVDIFPTSGKNIFVKVVKVTSKGQVTIPSNVRASLGIDEGSYLEVTEEGEEIRLRKVVRARPLSGDDPIWTLIGAGQSGLADVATDHDRHLATAEIERWRESS